MTLAAVDSLLSVAPLLDLNEALLLAFLDNLLNALSDVLEVLFSWELDVLLHLVFWCEKLEVVVIDVHAGELSL